MIRNKKTKVNDLLFSLLGDKNLINKWWNSPNKAFQGMTPIYLWKQTSKDQEKVLVYVSMFVDFYV